MSRYVGAVIFEDLTRLYLIYDGMLDAAMRPLFPSETAAWDWHQTGAVQFNEPKDADTSEQAVMLIADVSLEKDGGLGLVGSFASRASKKSMWLTGPRSFLELMYENGATASREY